MPGRSRVHDQYEHHPLAEMFPLLKDAEFADLAFIKGEPLHGR